MPIEAELWPLLKAMHAEAGGKGRVLSLSGDGASRKLRMYLRRAEVKRADLFVTDRTRKAIRFHDLRATGITWCVVRGDDAEKIMQRAGHENYENMRLYRREAENLSASFGVPFPPLPPELGGSKITPRYRPGAIQNAHLARKTLDSSGPSGARTRMPCGRGF